MCFAEPMTMLTDYLLAAVVAVLGLRLYVEGHATGQRAMRWWAGAFWRPRWRRLWAARTTASR